MRLKPNWKHFEKENENEVIEVREPADDSLERILPYFLVGIVHPQ